MTIWHPLIGVSPLFSAAVSASVGNRIAGHSDSFSSTSRASGVLSAPADIRPHCRATEEKSGTTITLEPASARWPSWALAWNEAADHDCDRRTADRADALVCGRCRPRVPCAGIHVGRDHHVSEQRTVVPYVLNGCLSYHIESMEQCSSRSSNSARGRYSIEFDLVPLFRMETDLRYATHAKALSAGIKSINEVRAEEDLPPVKGGEEPPADAVRAAQPREPASGGSARSTEAGSTDGKTPGRGRGPQRDPEIRASDEPAPSKIRRRVRSQWPRA